MPPLYGFLAPDDLYDRAELEAQADALIGPEPVVEDVPEEDFEVGGFDRLLEGSADALGALRPPRPARSFLEGLVYGGVGGLASRGQRTQEARQKFTAGQEQRQRRVDEQRIRSSAEYRKLRGETLRDLSKEQRAERTKAKDEEARLDRDRPRVTPELIAAAPWLGRAYKVGDRLDPEIARLVKPEAAPRESREDQGPYMTVQTPQGPKLMRAGEAARQGFVPTSTRETRVASAGEREQLTGDIGLLGQVGRIRKLFNKKYVGPASGRVGGTFGKVGALPKDQARFYGAVSAIRNQILKLRSGGAVTDGEAARLMDELPTIDNPSENFMSKLDEFENTFRTLAESRREILTGSGVDVSRFPALPVRPGSAESRVAPAASFAPPKGGFFDQNRPGAR